MVSVSSCDVPRWYLYPHVMFLDGICIRQCFTGTSVRDRNCDPIIGRIRLVRDSATRFLLSFNENVESDSFYSLNRKNSDSFYSMKMWSQTLSIQWICGVGLFLFNEYLESDSFYSMNMWSQTSANSMNMQSWTLSIHWIERVGLFLFNENTKWRFK